MQHTQTMNEASKQMNPNVQELFKQKDFADKKIVFILAKTWGAARMFYFKTALCKFRNIKIEYLSKDDQLQGLNRQDVIVIQLPRALETDRNVECLRMAKARNIKVLNFQIPDGV